MAGDAPRSAGPSARPRAARAAGSATYVSSPVRWRPSTSASMTTSGSLTRPPRDRRRRVAAPSRPSEMRARARARARELVALRRRSLDAGGDRRGSSGSTSTAAPPATSSVAPPAVVTTGAPHAIASSTGSRSPRRATGTRGRARRGRAARAPRRSTSPSQRTPFPRDVDAAPAGAPTTRSSTPARRAASTSRGRFLRGSSVPTAST